jgi:hypothetical protein
VATNLDVQLIDAYTGGVNLPSASQANQVAVANPQGNNLAYKPAAEAFTIDGSVAAALAPLLRGIGLTVDSNNKLAPVPRPRTLQLQDYFIGGTLTSGNIGTLGWNLFGTGTPAISLISGNLGNRMVRLTTTSGATDSAILCLGATAAGSICQPGDVNRLQASMRLPALTARRVFFGFSSDFSVSPAAAAECLGVMFDSTISATNWLRVARSASTGAPADNGIAALNNSRELITLYQPVAGTYQLYSGNNLLGTLNTNISVSALNIGIAVYNTTTTAANADFGAFNFYAPSIGGVLDDDAFLEA